MERFIKNIFDDLSVDETEELLNEVGHIEWKENNAELRTRILEKGGAQEMDRNMEFYITNNNRKMKKWKRIRNIAACFIGVILLSSVSVFAFSGKILFDFFLHQRDDKMIEDYVGYDGNIMLIDDYQLKVSSYLCDEELGSVYCVLTIEGENKTADDLKKFMNSSYIDFESSCVVVGGERTIQDNVVYIPILFNVNETGDMELLVIGGSAYVEEKEGEISEEDVMIIYEGGTYGKKISQVEFGTLNVDNIQAKKMPNIKKSFEQNALLTISPIGLKIEGLDDSLSYLSMENKNGEKEIFIENNAVCSMDVMVTTEYSSVLENSLDKKREKRIRLLYGKIIDLDEIAKIYINGEEIELRN